MWGKTNVSCGSTSSMLRNDCLSVHDLEVQGGKNPPEAEEENDEVKYEHISRMKPDGQLKIEKEVTGV